MAESLVAAVGPTGTVKVKPRRAWIAGLLALLQPGLGHLYGGRPVLALLIHFGPAVFTLSAAILSAFYPRRAFPVFTTLVAFCAVLWIWQLVSACLLARRQGTTYRLDWYNHVIIYALFIISVRGLIWLPALAAVRQRLIEPFKIPSASMAPTLLDVEAAARLSWASLALEG